MLKLENLIIAYCGFLSAFFLLSLLTLEGFLPSSNVFEFKEISFLISPYTPIMPITVPIYIGYNLSIILFAFILGVRMISINAKRGALSLYATGITGLLLLWFPMDPHGTPLTAIGISHIVLVALMSLYTVMALFFFASAFKHMKNLRWLSFYSYVISIIIAVVGIITVFVAFHNIPLVGLLERIPIAAFLLWLLLIAFGVLNSDKRIKHYFSFKERGIR